MIMVLETLPTDGLIAYIVPLGFIWRYSFLQILILHLDFIIVRASGPTFYNPFVRLAPFLPPTLSSHFQQTLNIMASPVAVWKIRPLCYSTPVHLHQQQRERMGRSNCHSAGAKGRMRHSNVNANVNGRSQGGRNRRFKAEHGRAQQWDVIKLNLYDCSSSFFFFFLHHSYVAKCKSYTGYMCDLVFSLYCHWLITRPISFSIIYSLVSLVCDCAFAEQNSALMYMASVCLPATLL